MVTTLARCLMHDHEFSITRCKQCCMLYRNGVRCRWLEGTDTSELLEYEVKLLRRLKGGNNMFITKDVKGKLEVHPGRINRLNPMESLKNIKVDDIEEFYVIAEVLKAEKTVKFARVEIEGENFPVQAPRKRRSSAEVAAAKAAKATATEEQ